MSTDIGSQKKFGAKTFQTTMESLIRGLSGAGVKVLLIDSGIWCNVGNLAGKNPTALRLDMEEGRPYVRPDTEIPENMHGTAIAEIVYSYAPKCRLTSLKVLDGRLKANLSQIIWGLAYALDDDFDIINLSLGTTKTDDTKLLRSYCRELRRRKAIVVASASNRAGNEAFYPANFSSVIAIGCAPINSSFCYFAGGHSKPDFIFDGHGLEEAAPLRSRTVSTSFAAARFTGIVTLLREKYPVVDVSRIKALMRRHALDQITRQ